MENPQVNFTSKLPHGQKRQPDNDLESEQRPAKRFNLLDLVDISKLYIHKPAAPQQRRTRSNAFSDSMNLDDTRYKIFINNIDDELSDIESEEEKLVFLPDIEKRLTRIPQSILGGRDESPVGNEVVLYGVPDSLSIPREQDNVRKAMIESRARARELQVREAGKKPTFVTAGSEELGKDQEHVHGQVNGFSSWGYGFDEDAMDIG